MGTTDNLPNYLMRWILYGVAINIKGEQKKTNQNFFTITRSNFTQIKK